MEEAQQRIAQLEQLVTGTIQQNQTLQQALQQQQLQLQQLQQTQGKGTDGDTGGWSSQLKVEARNVGGPDVCTGEDRKARDWLIKLR